MIFAALPTIWPVDLQTCLYIVEDYVNKHRCKINGTKSDVLRINTPNIEIDCWEICNQPIKETNSTIHLGITKNTTGNIDIENLIQHGRRTLYSLFGAGLHGKMELIHPPLNTYGLPSLHQDYYMLRKYYS